MHFFGLRWLAWLVQHREPKVRRPLLVVLFTIFTLHLVEVLLFAILLALIEAGGFGRLMGATYGGAGWFVDHFYFSIASYTTLGLGDIVPHGAIRMVAGLEALAGLVLVTWSASFTYLMMERLWSDRLPTKTETEMEKED
ncbi:two pore domain potassium channel family protein [Croceicoccus ponticola]|uniref:Two pore domain potassium channel family protein n=2 Tax=Croceicoccus ponticola TaxID=2217664 RepID=A0A437GXR6_9SPHN|nr:two pore domain potassium channel family protein [Croceicoccus ponticola]